MSGSAGARWDSEDFARKKKLLATRSSNIELLRIVSMILIVAHHFSIHAPWPDGIVLNDALVCVLGFGGKLGVNCFVLITGYFMVNSRFKSLSFLRVFLQTLFYSVGILLLFELFLPSIVNDFSPIRFILPSTSGLYWFVTCYLVLYCFIPFLNRLMHVLSCGALSLLCTVLFIIFSILPTLTTFNPAGSNFTWFVVLYCFGGFIRLWTSAEGRRLPVVKFLNPAYFAEGKKVCLAAFCVSMLFVCAYAVISVQLNASFSFGLNPRYFMSQYSVPLVLCSISLLGIFLHLRIPFLKTINAVASTTFGIYLIHDNPLVRDWLWPHFVFIYNGEVFFLFWSYVAVVAGTFCICSLIDQIRILALERPLFRRLSKMKCFSNFDTRINCLVSEDEHVR